MLGFGNSDSIISSATTAAYDNLLKKQNSTYQFHHFMQSHWGIVVTVSSVYRPQATDWSILQEHNLKYFDKYSITLKRNVQISPKIDPISESFVSPYP